jgi:hypothetical protein
LKAEEILVVKLKLVNQYLSFTSGLSSCFTGWIDFSSPTAEVTTVGVFFSTLGLALKGLFPEGWKVPNYKSLNLPGAEECCRREVTLPRQILLRGRKVADLIVAVIEKIKRST